MARMISGKRMGLLASAMLAACAPGGAGADAAANKADNAVEATAFLASASGNTSANAAQAAAAQDCRAFLIGVWTVRGPHDLLGQTRELDYRYEFRADGSYDTNMRYRNPGADWTDHRMSGPWRAAPAAGSSDPNACDLVMEVVGDGFRSSGTSQVVMAGPDRLDFGMGVMLQRERR